MVRDICMLWSVACDLRLGSVTLACSLASQEYRQPSIPYTSLMAWEGRITVKYCPYIKVQYQHTR